MEDEEKQERRRSRRRWWWRRRWWRRWWWWWWWRTTRRRRRRRRRSRRKQGEGEKRYLKRRLALAVKFASGPTKSSISHSMSWNYNEKIREIRGGDGRMVKEARRRREGSEK